MADDARAGRWRGDVIAGIVLLLVAAIGFWLTASFREVPAMLSQNVPPTFFPRLVLGVISLLSLVLIARGLRKTVPAPPPVRPTVLSTSLAIVLTPLAVGLLGTWLTIGLVCLTVPCLWGERRWLEIGLLAVGMPIFVYVVFAWALELRFPLGRLFEPLF